MVSDYDIFDNFPAAGLEKDMQLEGEIPLSEFDAKPYDIPNDFEEIQLEMDAGDYDASIREVCDDLLDVLTDYGYPSSLYTGIYESILNAFQHGNNAEPDKNIVVAYDVSPDRFVLNIKDEGNAICPEFVDYYLNLRQGDCIESFYNYSGQDRNGTNQGHGIKFMNTYFDDVRYFKAGDGGLVAHLYKEK